MHDDAPEPIHADDTIVVLDKPAGLLAVRGRHVEDCLALRAARRWPDVQVVHRLDQATSGLIVFARGADVQRLLSMAFAQREVGKRYVAVVAGQVTGENGEIDAPLAADWPNRPRQQVDRVRGKPSLTRWRVLQRGERTTRLELEPVTGRSHQLRVHLAHLGHPIVGDTLYAPPDIADASRLLLHATRLELRHPRSGEALAFHSPPPF